MSEMVERVERAILTALEKSDPSAFLGERERNGTVTIDGRFNLSDIARAAIEAMREPTHEIFMAGRNFAIGPREADSVRERWKKQIDAALDPSSVQAIDNVR